MAATATFEVQAREKTGSAEARRLRKQGFCPGNLYGGDGDPIPFSVPQDNIRQLLSSGNRIVDFKLGGKAEKCLVQELQWDVFSTHVTHVDLLRVDAKQRVQVEVSIEPRGVAPGVVAGGKLKLLLRRLAIDCLALEIPEALQVNVNELKIGDSITVADLELPDGVIISTPESTPVLQVLAPVDVSDEELEPADAGPAEPEVIGKSSSDDEGSEE